jgi:hypothetical protein
MVCLHGQGTVSLIMKEKKEVTFTRKNKKNKVLFGFLLVYS